MSDRLQDIYNYLLLSITEERAIATAGQPTVAQFAAIRAAGYEVVINLALDSSDRALAGEAAIVQALGMTHIHIPVLWEQPTPEDFHRFVTALQTHADQSVFVHCALNMRVSAFMYLYRRLYTPCSATTAQVDLQRIWTPNPQWQAFIQQMLAQ